MNEIIVNFIALAWLIAGKYLTTLGSVHLLPFIVDETSVTTWNLLPKIFYVQCKVYVDGGFTSSELFRFRRGRTYQRILLPPYVYAHLLNSSYLKTDLVKLWKKLAACGAGGELDGFWINPATFWNYETNVVSVGSTETSKSFIIFGESLSRYSEMTTVKNKGAARWMKIPLKSCLIIFLNNNNPPEHRLNQIQIAQRIGKWVRRLIKISLRFGARKRMEIEILHRNAKSLSLVSHRRMKWVDGKHHYGYSRDFT